MPETIHVVAGVLHDTSGRVLIAQRLAGTHMAGRWEFPGGKLRPDEPRRDGLLRELKEELGITVTACAPLIRLRHNYPEREVLLDFWQVQHFDGDPVGVEGQALKWLSINKLSDVDLLEADRPVIDSLRLPDRYAITPGTPNDLPSLDAFVDQIAAVAADGVTLIQLRVPGITFSRLHTLAVAAVQGARGAAILINGDPKKTIPLALATGAAGVHVPARFLSQLSDNFFLPKGLLVGASCHDLDELKLAADCGANFAVLGPVLATATHPDVPGMGWDRFGELADQANLPVYALGGVATNSIERAKTLGAQGVAGIRAFFGE